MSFLYISDFSKSELLALSSTIAIAISNQLSKEDIAILATFFTVLGDNLALFSL